MRKTIPLLFNVPRQMTAGRHARTVAVAVLVAIALLVVWRFPHERSAANAFAFLWVQTGWQMGQSILSQGPADPYWYTLLLGALNSLLLGLAAIFLGTLIGGAVALLRLSEDPLIERLTRAYVAIFRNVPLLLQALCWFAILTNLPGPRQAIGYGGFLLSNRGMVVPWPTVAGIEAAAVVLAGVCVALFARRLVSHFRLSGRHPKTGNLAIIGFTVFGCILTIDLTFGKEPLLSLPALEGFNFVGGGHVPTELLAMTLALTLFGSAYIAEIFRGALGAVPHGVVEAAQALGLSRPALEFLVRIPIALRSALPPLASQYTVLLKSTSIGLAVGYADLYAVTLSAINQSGNTVALLVVMSIMFMFFNIVIVLAVSAINSFILRPGNQRGLE
jgi:His/Glu/Gln/Arg/opine family amino acid ABC transporter permease subunit